MISYLIDLNLFHYLSFRIIATIFTSTFIALFIAPKLIRFLQKFTQPIRDDGPQSHLAKQGTPTMGGLIFLSSAYISTLLWMKLDAFLNWLILGTVALFALIGFMDDYLKIKHKNSGGLSSRKKLLGQLFAGIAFITVLISYGDFDFIQRLYIPYTKNFFINMGYFSIIFFVFILIGTSNAINLTDGLDGLAAGTSIIALFVFLGICYCVGYEHLAKYLYLPYVNGSQEITILIAAFIGGLTGFLWYNSYPASIFMGDLGSLSLGALFASLAIVLKHELILAIAGGVFIMETISVILQVASYKIRKKRIFLMAPIHHHFERKGWSEQKVVIRFFIMAFLLAIIAISSLKIR